MLKAQDNQPLVGLLVVTHGNYGDNLLNSARHVLGDVPEQCAAIAIDDDAQSNAQSLDTAINTLNTGAGVLVLTDIYGATPSNMVTRFLAKPDIKSVAGVNLPMLIKSINYQDQPLDALVQKAIIGGREGVVQFDQQSCDHYQANRANKQS